MSKKLCITLDLEPDYAGSIDEMYDACDIKKLDYFFKMLDKYGVKLTVFVVGKMLENPLPIIKKLGQIGADFQLHSYSHKVKGDINSLEEIQKGKNAFFNYFGYNPIGYRAPQGRIRTDELKTLNHEGFKFDSSIFPSFWPNLDYIFKKRNPYKIKNLTIKEFPIATTPFRLIISQSWINLLGWNFYKRILTVFPTPKVFVYDMHLHDFVKPNSYNKLNHFWKFIYSKADLEADNLEKILILMTKKKYKQVFIKDLI